MVLRLAHFYNLPTQTDEWIEVMNGLGEEAWYRRRKTICMMFWSLVDFYVFGLCLGPLLM